MADEQDEVTLDALERKYGLARPDDSRDVGLPDRAAAALLGVEDAIDAAQEARWHTSRRRPTIRISGPSATGPAFGRRVDAAHREGWGEPAWDAYYRAFAAQLAAMDVALIAKLSDDAHLSVVDLRRFEPRPGFGFRLDEPVILANPDEGWRLRGRWRRARALLFTS